MSGPSGEEPSGTVSFDLAIGTFSGAVTCLAVDGNEATVGVVVGDGSTGAPAGSGFILHVIDGSATGTADQLRLELLELPPAFCPEVNMISPAAVTSGDVSVIDAAAPVTISSLAADVRALQLPRGVSASLLVKLAVADRALRSGHTAVSCAALAAFVRQVNTLAGIRIPPPAAEQLAATAQELRNANC